MTPAHTHKRGLVWIRRDIRLHDHPALAQSLSENDYTYLVFVFDTTIIDPLLTQSKEDRRLHFIAESLLEINQTLHQTQAGLILIKGNPTEEIPKLIQKHNISSLYFNRDYEPSALGRDQLVTQKLHSMGVQVQSFKDHVIFEPHDIIKKDNTPYRVFTPYSKTWIQQLHQSPELLTPYACDLTHLKNDIPKQKISVKDILDIAGFIEAPAIFTGGSIHGKQRLDEFTSSIDTYHIHRDIPSINKTSSLSPYIRHGCVSIRDLVNTALKHQSPGADCWLNELIWREFYQMVLGQFPHVVTQSFNETYTHLKYPNSEEWFDKWKEGQTGFPIIDAAMRYFKKTGWMHNRLRMVTASFLCKILLVDWKKGEEYFASLLLDYDCAANNGGWQWAAGTGCDAAPYFRIFNPYTQSKKFDEKGTFIRRHCPELAHLSDKHIHTPPTLSTYPKPIVDYANQRKAALELYKNAPQH